MDSDPKSLLEAQSEGWAIDRSRVFPRTVDEAYLLLLFATEQGRSVPDEVRAAILKAKAAPSAAGVPTAEEEAAFQDAYERLSAVVRPVTARSLRETDDTSGRSGRFRRFFGLPRISTARRFAYRFIWAAVALTALIVVSDSLQSYLAHLARDFSEMNRISESIARKQAEREDATSELATAVLGRTADSAYARQLKRRSAELDLAIRLETEQFQRVRTAIALPPGLRSSEWLFVNGDAGPVVVLQKALSEYLVPLLYGGLGACAFILRGIVARMRERSFDHRKLADYVVRVVLGMLSGLSLQWMFVRSWQAIPGGFTPAVLAFVGGYGVEIVFTAFDRVVALVTAAIKGPAAPPRAPQPRKNGASQKPAPEEDAAGG